MKNSLNSMKKKVKNIVISGTNFWNPGDDFVRDGVINILRRLFDGYTLNFLFYNFNQDFFPQSKFSGISNTAAKGDLEQYGQFVDAVVIAGLSAGSEIKDLYNWVIGNKLQDRVYMIGAGYENDYVDKHISLEPEATIFKSAKIITGRTRKRPEFITKHNIPYFHINCPAILSVKNVKNIAPGKKAGKIGFSIQLPHKTGVPNHACAGLIYKLAVEMVLEVSSKYDVEIIAHHKSEYFHFLDLFRRHNVPVPVVFSSFYHDLFDIYPRYDLVITTRLHAALFANGHGIPGIILNDTDRHTHCLEGFPHSVWANTREKFNAEFNKITVSDLSVIAHDAKAFKAGLMDNYLKILAGYFDVGESVNQSGLKSTAKKQSGAGTGKVGNAVTNGAPEENSEIAEAIVASIAGRQVKGRVLSVISRLEKDYWLEKNIRMYEEALKGEAGWFDAASFLNWYAHHFQPGTYLEVGVRRGRSMAQVLTESPETIAFGFDLWIPDYGSLPEKNIHTPNPGPDFVISELKRLGIKKLPTLCEGDSGYTLPAFWSASKDNQQKIDLILIDGDHTYDGAKKDLDIAFSHLAPGGALVFDDISHDAHPELRELWNEYIIRFPDYFFIKDTHGTGTGVAFKPPFDRLADLANDRQGTDGYHFDSEHKEQIFVRSVLQKGMTVFDVGANIGKYTRLFSLLVGGKGKVYAFEPSKSSFDKLHKAIKENNCSNVTLINKAVYSTNDKVMLNEFPEEYSSWNSIGLPIMQDPKDPQSTVPIERSAEVETVTLDRFCLDNNIEKIDYLKLDVEGVEAEALEGASGLLEKKAIGYLQFEISRQMLEGANTNARAVFDFLYAKGYQCHSITNEGGLGGKASDSGAFYENYAAFPVDSTAVKNEKGRELPIHFFTIVQNGEPFIRHHIEVFRRLPFKWHWHIIEGMADLKHDTSWSLQFGGRITDDLHRNGLSNDGTTEYLNEVAQRFPGNVTIYRKPSCAFWDGKLEMVSAPLKNITEECLLWQVDADELWTVEQISTARLMFLQNPGKTAAQYLCRYFVGESLVITTFNTYGNHIDYEWVRTWRYSPGCRWISHEPPRLCRQAGNGDLVDLSTINLLNHRETSLRNLVFQHYAYATEKQVRFKELYYGYTGAVEQWQKLQSEVRFPSLLRNYFPWVTDDALVNTTRSQNIRQIAQKFGDSCWYFREAELPYNEPQNILLVRTDSIGDNVLASSILPFIREKHGEAVIAIVCQEHIAELYKDSPCIDIIIPFDKVKMSGDEQYREHILRLLRLMNFDLALNSAYSRDQSADMLSLCSGAAGTAAFYGDLCNIPQTERDKNNRLYSKLISSGGVYKTEIERYRDLLKAFDIEALSLKPMVWTADEDKEYAEAFFHDNDLKPETTIALFPGAQHYHKVYPDYDDVLKHFDRFDFIVLGGNDERSMADEICKKFRGRAFNLAGKTTIRQTAELIRKSRLYVGSDSSGAHIACAVNTPNVVILGGGHFGRFIPYSSLTSVVCFPLECYHCRWICKYQTVHCVKDILPELVVQAIQQTLQEPCEKPRVFVQSGSLRNLQVEELSRTSLQQCLDMNSVKIIDSELVEEARALNQKGEDLYLNGNTAEAFDMFSKAIDIIPNFATAHNNLGVLFWQKGETEKAIKYFRAALRIDHSDRDTIRNCVNILTSMDDFEDAEKLCVSFLRNNPDDKEITTLLTNVLLTMTEHE